MGTWCGALVVVSLAAGCAPSVYRAPAPAMVPQPPELPEPREVLSPVPSVTLDPFQRNLAAEVGCPKPTLRPRAQLAVSDQDTVDPFCFSSPAPRCESSPALAGDDAIIDPFCGAEDHGG